MCVIGHGRQNIGQTAIRHVNMAKKWKRPKTAQKHEIRLNAEKTSQERANSASGGDGRAGFPIPHVTRLKNWPVFEPDMLSRPITGISGNPPKLYTRKAEKFPELLGSENAPPSIVGGSRCGERVL